MKETIKKLETKVKNIDIDRVKGDNELRDSNKTLTELVDEMKEQMSEMEMKMSTLSMLSKKAAKDGG